MRSLGHPEHFTKNTRWDLLWAGRARPQVFIARWIFVCLVFIGLQMKANA